MKSLVSGLRVMRLLEMSESPVTAQQIGQALNMPRSTVYRLLKTLSDQGFIEPTSRGLIPGLYLTQTSRNPVEGKLQSGSCRDLLSAIAEAIEETVVLTVVRWPHAFALAAVEGPRAVRWSFTAGSRHPLYAGASAKVLLAYLSDEALADYEAVMSFFPTGSRGPQCWDDVFRQVTEIRGNGYCISRGEVDEGVAALAFPIRQGARVVGSISVVGPEFRFQPHKHVATLGEMVARIEKDIEDS